MNKLKQYIKREMDVEFFCCVHGISMIFVLGFYMFLCGVKAVPYAIIFEMFCLGYVIAWIQKLLFLKDKLYRKWEYGIRSGLWIVLPVILMWVSGQIFHWMEGLPGWVEPAFLVTMLIYDGMVYAALRLIYQDDTEYLNQMLTDIKRKEEK